MDNFMEEKEPRPAPSLKKETTSKQFTISHHRFASKA